jgi:hypothetical protein
MAAIFMLRAITINIDGGQRNLMTTNNKLPVRRDCFYVEAAKMREG